MSECFCGNGWGIGINIYKGQNPSYGFPESSNPYFFYPDQECCSLEEIKNWEQAKKEFNEKNNKPN